MRTVLIRKRAEALGGFGTPVPALPRELDVGAGRLPGMGEGPAFPSPAERARNTKVTLYMAGMKDVQQFVEDVQSEMKRVTWPDREQLRNATAVILVFVIIIAIIIGLMDGVFAWFVRMFVRIFGG